MAKTTKYYKEQEWVKFVGDNEWHPTDNYRKGEVYENNSVDCGASVTDYKLKLRYTDGSISYVPWDANHRENWIGKTDSFYPNKNETLITDIWIGSGVTTIRADFLDVGGGIFASCPNLSGVTFGSGFKIIGGEAFRNCNSLRHITFPNTLTKIGYWSFNGCHYLEEANIPNSVTDLEYFAFGGCISLTGATLPTGLTSIGFACFDDCINLRTINIPTTLTSIGYNCFAGCHSLNIDLVLPSGITEIKEHTFEECHSLRTVTIPSGVTSIEHSSFTCCSGLTSITVLATTPPTIDQSAFYYTNRCPIYVPSGSVNAYKAASGWSYYSSRIQGI